VIDHRTPSSILLSCIVVAAGFALLLTPTLSLAAENDWASWRGPNRDGVSVERGLLTTWPEDGPPLVWEAKNLGRGYASVAVAAGRIYTMGQRDGQEFLIALDAADGGELWAAAVGNGDHSNCTPTVDGDRVYALGLKGELVCVAAADGREIWRKHFKDDFGGRMMSGWGYSESPLIDGERLICTPGARDAAIAALDKHTGAVIWTAAMPENVGSRGQDGAAYSSVVISNAAGVRQYVQLTGRGVIGVAADDGRTLWTYNRIANGTANIPTPLVRDDYVFCSSGYDAGAALLKISPSGDGLRADEVYFLDARQMQNHHGGMILLGDHIYCGHGHGQGYPLCIEMLTGRVAWRERRGPGDNSAAILYADGHLYFRYENGLMALIEATPEEYRLKGTFQIAANNGPSWPHPVISDGKLYLRDQEVLLCYDVRKP